MEQNEAARHEQAHDLIRELIEHERYMDAAPDWLDVPNESLLGESPLCRLPSCQAPNTTNLCHANDIRRHPMTRHKKIRNFELRDEYERRILSME